MAERTHFVYRGPTPELEWPGIRDQLIAAVLADDSAAFIEVLRREAPTLVGKPRTYVVLTMTPDGMSSLMVDHAGVKPDPGYLLMPNVPVEQLNVTFGPEKVTVDDRGDRYTLPMAVWLKAFPNVQRPTGA